MDSSRAVTALLPRCQAILNHLHAKERNLINLAFWTGLRTVPPSADPPVPRCRPASLEMTRRGRPRDRLPRAQNFGTGHLIPDVLETYSQVLQSLHRSEEARSALEEARQIRAELAWIVRVR